MLDLTQYATSTDSPEMAEYKTKVEEVARRYAKQNNWCRVIDDVLRDLDIRPERKVLIDVTTSFGLVLTHSVKPSALVGLSDEEQRALVASEIGSLSVTGSSAAGRITLTPEMVADLSLPETGARTEGWVENEAVPGQGTWLYNGIEGRVEHFFPEMEVVNGRIVHHDSGRWFADYHRRATALCGADTYTLRLTSPRSEQRHCAKCQERLARRT
jgi:hypothetical protein